MPTPPGAPRYRFAGHTLSPARRTLIRDGRELPLIPRCFDLLVLLVERRNEAVSRHDLLDAVWNDVAVTDGALSQAVRILPGARWATTRASPPSSGPCRGTATASSATSSKSRTWGRRRPRRPSRPSRRRQLQAEGRAVRPGGIRPRPLRRRACGPLRRRPAPPPRGTGGRGIAVDRALEALLDDGSGDADEAWTSGGREAAETLHRLGTAAALDRLDRRPGHAVARAYLRETRWDVPGAGPVPLLGHPGWLAAAGILFLLRIRRVARLAGRRWLAAAAGGAAAGAVAGFLGGLVLRFGPGSTAGASVLAMLPLLGTAVGGVAAAGVGAGLAAAEAAFRARRRLALAAAGAASGLTVAAAAHLLGRLVLEGLFGRDLSPLTGAVEGLALGGAVGLGYGLATPTAEGGMATPHGLARVRAALLTGLACGLAAGMLGWSGRFLGAMSLDFMAQSFPGSQVGLAPLARLLGEPEPGVVTRVAISAFEGLMFGSGLAAGLTRDGPADLSRPAGPGLFSAPLSGISPTRHFSLRSRGGLLRILAVSESRRFAQPGVTPGNKHSTLCTTGWLPPRRSSSPG